MALGSAPALYTLFTKHLSVNPIKPEWINRDRFVLASGHASSLLYAQLHLSGFDLSIQDLKSFRQWGSKTPGHPEALLTPGVDASSGPLGQGIPMAVGMAMAERFLATRFNKKDYKLIDHYTYVLCGDGDMQEGVTYEASSLAGHYALGKLIVIYDSNDVTLDGPLSYSFSENVKKRYEAMHWQVIEVDDGNDINKIHKAINKAKREAYKPTLIINKTIIGYGSVNQGTSIVHGTPLGKEDGQHAKNVYHYDHEPFFVPDEVYDHYRKTIYNRGIRNYKKWQKIIKGYSTAYSDDYAALMDAINDRYDFDYEDLLANYPDGKMEATRQTSWVAIQEIAKQNQSYFSGTADLASSTKTLIDGENRFGVDDYTGRNIFFGIREFGMIAIMNGMTLHKGVKVSGGGFLVFSDYFKAALRMAGLMELPIIMPLSHDSVAVGEDGPTHQPIEQLAMLRSCVGLLTIRPADVYELFAGWKIALQSKNIPVALILTRQEVKTITHASYHDVKKGAYIVVKEDPQRPLDGIIIAAGSEVNLAIEASQVIKAQGDNIRVVSMPCQELFNAQPKSYREMILPNSCRKRLAIEMGSEFGWHKYVGLDGAVMSIDTFGTSAPAQKIIDEYGFKVTNVVGTYNRL